ncbi:MAG: hypothetical protein CMN30_03345 [Sandaracinus sp.]|nr:hypothetical protein [Sandaracinus sp.]|tara:strand:+ start:128 stop:1003 length:876 start_codon:yes stop_codon:yes gene_type:complete
MILVLTLTALCASFPSTPAAADDRVSLGDDIHVRVGDHVDDVFTMGGDIRIDGVAAGDVATAGGDVVVTGTVEGDVATAGGDIRIEGTVEGDVATAGGQVVFGSAGVVGGDVRGGTPGVSIAGSHREESFFGSFFEKLGSFALLFLLVFGFRRLAGDRFDTVRAAIVRAPLKTPLMGLAFFLVALVAILGSAVTVVGIPVAAVLALALVLAIYVGLGMSAAVLGAMLPVERLQGRETAQLAAGVGVLFVLSLIPLFGGLSLMVATLVGLGAVAMTRLGQKPLMPSPEGPYR